MNDLLKILSDNPAFKAFDERKNILGNLNLSEEALMIASSFQKNKQPMLIVKNNLYTAQRLYESLTPLLKDEVLLFSVEESLRVEAIAASPEQLASEIEILETLLKQKKVVCITHSAGYTKFLPNPKVFNEYSYHLKVNDICSYEDMIKNLYYAGYQKVTYVDQPLCYASRGGIIDVYSMNYDYPIRIEFFDNEIDSIRYFDIASKRTIQTLEEVEIIPASDILFTQQDSDKIICVLKEKQAKTTKQELIDHIDEEIRLLDEKRKERHLAKYYAYLDRQYSLQDYMQDVQVIISTYEEVKQTYKRISEENIAYIQELQQINMSLPMYHFCNDLDRLLKDAMLINLFVNEKTPILSQIEEISYVDISLQQKILEIAKAKEEYCIIFSLKESEQKQIKVILEEHGINFSTRADLSKGIHLMNTEFNEGFIAHYEKIMVYTSKELFDVVHHRNLYANKFKEAEALTNYLELENGDFVVHKLYGVGKYLGIVTREKDGIHKDYLRIVYKGNDELLIPLEQFKLIRKFVSKEGATPKLNKLGSGDWEKTKAKVSESVKELADRLVKLYSLREKHIGYAFSKDTPFQAEFESDFDYQMTVDQQIAIDEIKRDMEKDVPMDRLLCGDVGFGKTEVALRAAFKAVMDNKQVAFLCPTTILSQQHLKTAIKRFRNFPVSIKVVNRFVSTKEMKEIKQSLVEGKIDILIGTHRLLSKDIKFKDLGLLIIDEEQRFGVEHKEKIKELKTSIDVLSLSATPIPRTLQMSLIGIRSLSQLNTPPSNRMSVQTYVIEKNIALMKEVIERELSRDGQVFYLYNNVKEIYNVATRLQKQIKGLKVGVAHGKMHRDEIEDVMFKFTNKEYQVLVCTTIIETGIDIPNANTILIEDADHFGLSQLYQIKGRVGRSSRLAYAYLMYSPRKQLSEIAMKRLKSMKEFAKLGSGYKIALRDLTIRGAGDMLGPKQAGFIDTIGMDMYIEMLNEAIQESKGEKVEVVEVEEKKANIKVDAYIPEKFEQEDYEKISLYQRMDRIKNKQELLAMQEEIIDTYGKLPKAVELLFEKKKLDIMINEPHVAGFKELKQEIEIEFTNEWSDHIDGVKLFEQATTLSTDIKIRYANQKIYAKLPKRSNYLPILIEFISMTEKMQ
ncbi:MAG: transcription-repair coupling factor [Erysipelotrichia bacterium]|nr:transcription-repair coupling factor [Erysipelotrichia bacterium]